MKKTALITGATSGIGKATAILLAKKGWTIIVHGRVELACKATVDEIIKKTNNKNINNVIADLSDLKSVNKMADLIIKEYPRLNILVNNAGTFSIKRITTDDGFEKTFVVNYLSRVLLTHRLINTLKENKPSRIIDVSGAYHSKGEIYFDDITLIKGYTMSKANNQSKLGNVLYTYKLSRLLNSYEITVNTIHLGAVNTGSIIRKKELSWLLRLLYRITSVFFKTSEQGASTPVFLASSSEVEGQSGKYFVDKKESKSSKMSYDIILQEKLYDFSLNWLEDHKYI